MLRIVDTFCEFFLCFFEKNVCCFFLWGRVQSPILALDQLLELRRRLTTGISSDTEGPWPRLRATWLSWMTGPRRKRWRSQMKSQEIWGKHGEKNAFLEKIWRLCFCVIKQREFGWNLINFWNFEVCWWRTLRYGSCEYRVLYFELQIMFKHHGKWWKMDREGFWIQVPVAIKS